MPTLGLALTPARSVPAFWQPNCMSWGAGQPPFVAVNLVPLTVTGDREDRSLAATIMEAKAVAQVVR